MKRVLAVLLAAVLAFASGCQKADEVVDAPETSDAIDVFIEAEPTKAAAESEQAESPQEPAPIVRVELKDYAYEVVNNQTLGLSFKYPSHWLPSAPKENRIRFVEPVEPGEFAASVSITRKDPGNIVITEDIGMDQLSAFSKQLKKRYTKYKMKKGKRLKISKNTAFCFTYTGEVPDGTKIKGYAALVYLPGKKNRFFLLHFNCRADQYANYSKILSTIRKSIRV